MTVQRNTLYIFLGPVSYTVTALFTDVIDISSLLGYETK